MTGCGTRVDVPPISDFDLTSYLGKWYEIARLDHKFERDMDFVNAVYTIRSDGKIGVRNRGYNSKRKKWKESTAYAIETGVPGQLKVYFFFLIGGDYKVAFVNKDYTYAVVSGGTTNYLWLLSRNRSVDKATLSKMLRIAENLGYDTSKLIYPKQ